MNLKILTAAFALLAVLCFGIGAVQGRSADKPEPETVTVTEYVPVEKVELRYVTESVGGDLRAEYIGDFQCTAYCCEEYPHICGTGTGITASGAHVTPDVSAALCRQLLGAYPYGTWLYIEGVGLRQVQDTGAALESDQIDVAVDTHEHALAWKGYGRHRVWVMREAE